jgi:D-alanyl-D-alanine dipeptidase
MQGGARANRGLASYPRGLTFSRRARAKARKRVFAPDVAGIHVFFGINRKKDVDGRNRSGHDHCG